MSIISSAPEQKHVTAETALPEAVRDVLEYANAYQQMAAFFEANPDLAAQARNDGRGNFLICVVWTKDPLGEIKAAIRRANEAGVPVTEYVSEKYGGVQLNFGPVWIQVYASAEQAVRQVVVGHVPDVRRSLVVDLHGNARQDAEQAEAVA